MSEKQYRDKIASLKKEQARDEAAAARAREAAGKHRVEASRQAAKITPRTSETMARSYRRAAESAEAKAVAEDRKAATAAGKLAKLAQELARAEASLAREVQTAARKADSAQKAAARALEREAEKRRQAETRHAREIARLSTVRVVHEVHHIPPPKPERLRVLYLAANPDMNLRVDVEVRQVQQAVRAALHRDQVELFLRMAATPEDLLDGLNDVRPHVVHFSGHAGDAAVVFDNASVDTPEGRAVGFELLGHVLSATETPPTLLVLNGCDTVEGAEMLLRSSPVVVAMGTEITDLGAVTFAARFYAAIASAQPIQAALQQGSAALDLLGLDEGRKPTLLVRPGLSLDDMRLVTAVQA